MHICIYIFNKVPIARIQPFSPVLFQIFLYLHSRIHRSPSIYDKIWQSCIYVCIAKWRSGDAKKRAAFCGARRSCVNEQCLSTIRAFTV